MIPSVIAGIAKPRRRRSGVVSADLKVPASRASAILQLLRRDDSMCDFTIVVADKQIPIHSSVVATVSPFFSTALSGDFAEAAQRRLVIGDATFEAVQVVLDFGYGIDVTQALHREPPLAWRVWALAHRFEMPALSEIVGFQLVEAEPVGKSVEIFRQARWYGCKPVERHMQSVIRANIHRVAEAAPDFTDLTVNELQEILSSGPHTYQSEFNKYRAVKSWILHKKDERMKHLDDVFQHIRFESFSRSEFDIFDKDIEMIPKRVLLKALRRSSQAVKEVRRELENRRHFYDGHDEDEEDEGSPYSF